MSLLFLLLAGTPPAAAASDVQRQVHLERAAMGTLGGWAVVNLGAGVTGAFTADDPRVRGLWQASAAWNTVNLAIAGFGLHGAARLARDPLSPPELLTHQRRLRTAFLVNAALDIGYIAGGAGLSAWARGRDDGLRQGWGEAVIVQGAFLLVFDLVMAGLQGRAIRAAIEPTT